MVVWLRILKLPPCFERPEYPLVLPEPHSCKRVLTINYFRNVASEALLRPGKSDRPRQQEPIFYFYPSNAL